GTAARIPPDAGTAPRIPPDAGTASRIPAYTVVLLTVLLLAAVAAAATVRPAPAGLVAWGRLLPWHGEPAALYVGEGVNASIAVTEEANGWRNFHVSGKVEA